MNMKIHNYVQRNIDNALTQIFFNARLNDFDKNAYSPVYVCTFKNKLIILKSKENIRSKFENIVEINCPAAMRLTRDEHLIRLLKLMPTHLKIRLEKALKYVDKKHKLDYCWQYIHDIMPFKCQDYFENFLQSRLCKFRITKEYNQLVELLARTLYVNKNNNCSELELSILITDVISSLKSDIGINELNNIVDTLFISNALSVGISD